jgi:alkylhydroperoxidase family enzyme
MDSEHLHIDKQSPEAYKSLAGVSTAVMATAEEAGLSRELVELVNARARKVLTDDELSAVIWVATASNAFNRVSILSRHPVKP